MTRSAGRTRAAIMCTASFILHSKRKLAFLVELGKNVLISILCTYAKISWILLKPCNPTVYKGDLFPNMGHQYSARKGKSKNIVNAIKKTVIQYKLWF